MAYIQSYEIGLTYGSRVNVESLTTLAVNMGPHSFAYEYSETVETGDGGSISRGKPYFVWRWDGFFYFDMFNAFRVLCPGASASVVIRTLKPDYVTYAYYDCKMIWPDLTSYEQTPNSNGKSYTGFSLRFNNPVLYTP